jgi:hypothetical protein
MRGQGGPKELGLRKGVSGVRQVWRKDEEVEGAGEAVREEERGMVR